MSEKHERLTISEIDERIAHLEAEIGVTNEAFWSGKIRAQSLHAARVKAINEAIAGYEKTRAHLVAKGEE